MCENENRNMNGLGNENMEHRDVSEATVNQMIPGDERNRQGQNMQGHRTMDPEAHSQETQGQYSQAWYSQTQEGQDFRRQHREQYTRGPDAIFGSYGNQTRRQDYCGGNTYQGYPGSGDKQRSRSNKGRFTKRAAGITAAAIFFGAVSGGTMTGVNYLGNRPTGAYGTMDVLAGMQAQNRIAQATPANAQAPTNRDVTAVSAVTDVSGIMENAMPSIMAVNDTVTVEQRDFFEIPQTYIARSSGSGIIVNWTDTELPIATNNCVVDGAPDLEAIFVDNKGVSAVVKGTDSASDPIIIVVQLGDIPSDTMSRIKVAILGNPDNIKVGQQVTAMGNALGYGQSVTVGYVSTLDCGIIDEKGISRTFVRTNAAINPGNSDGAPIDLNESVIGIGAVKTASTEVEGMGFAIPVSKSQDILNSLITKRTRMAVSEDAQGYLGIQGTNISAATSQMYGMLMGVCVHKVVGGGAVSSFDLKEKGIITKSDDQSITSMERLEQMLIYYEGGAAVTPTVQSLVDGVYMERDVQVILGTKPAAQSQRTGNG